MNQDASLKGAASHRFAVHSLFMLSGALALVYQLAWVRVFSLEFGSTTLSVATVVSVFMGGLAAGALWGGRIGERSRNPLRVYGFLELGLTGYVLASPATFPLVMVTVGGWAAPFGTDFGQTTAVRFFVATLLILPPTLLMGATLPLLSAWLARHSGAGSFRATTLYSWNTIGATLGAFSGGFLLLPKFGLQSSVFLAAGLNLSIALISLSLSIRNSSIGRDADKSSRSLSSNPERAVFAHFAWVRFLPGIAVALAAAGTMACQVIWTRVTTLVLGASVHAFSVVLTTFLAGLGLGALITSLALRGQRRHAALAFTVLCFFSALALTATAFVFPHLPIIALRLHEGLNLNPDAGALIRLQLLVAGALLLPPTIMFGGLLPAALLAFADQNQSISRGVGNLYAWNVLGSIVGTLVAGFVLLPWLGAIESLLLAGGTMLLAGIAASGSHTTGAALRATAVAIPLSIGILSGMPTWDKQLMTSGVHSYAVAYGDHRSPDSLAALLSSHRELLYYADGLTATISVTRDKARSDRQVLTIYTNGKADGSSIYDMPTQRLIAHIPILLHPNPTNVAVIGMGTGSTAGSASLHSASRITVVEIEARMVEAARLFRAHNHAVHHQENVEVIITDGRTHLLRQNNFYDVIISVPSNPWLAGSSDLFTSDYFRRSANALRDEGIFAQWIQLYGMSAENLQMVIRGFLDTFPETLLASTILGADVLLIGSLSPITIDLQNISHRMAYPAISKDLADDRVRIRTVYDLLARIRVSSEALREFVGDGQRHTDDHPILSYRAPRDLHRDTRAENEAAIAGVAKGITPLIRFGSAPEDHRGDDLTALAHAYERFLPGGSEAVQTRRLLDIEANGGNAGTPTLLERPTPPR
jgi:spermidine synthase